MKGTLKDMAAKAHVSEAARQRFKSKLQEARQSGTEKKLLQAASTKLAPKMNMTDGNPCRDDEEFLATMKLCYKKCSLLTKGSHPIRTSPWHCCKQSPCIFNLKHDYGVCSGYSVAGGMGESCPHETA